MAAGWRKRLPALAVCALLLLQAGPRAWAQTAEEGETGPDPAVTADERAPESGLRVIDPEELEALTEQAIADQNFHSENLSIGYCYLPTGETWYYNEDTWYYSASLYKVPLMMIMAQREYEGELTQDTKLAGSVTLGYAEDRILVHSNNELAHTVMHYIGTDRECRELYQQFSDMPVEDYHSNFYNYSYFTVRFMTDVMKTLYYEQERFPNILDCLKKAQPDGWFNKTGNHEYEIAQKYGAYEEFYHTSGIVYTPNPFLLTVMTKNAGYVERNIAQIKQVFQDYTLSLDGKLEQARADYAAQKAEEAERLAEEEARRAEEERLAREAAAAQTAPPQTALPETPAPAPAEEQSGSRAWPAAVGGGALGLLGVGLLTRAKAGRRKQKTAAGAASRGGGDKHYHPRH